MDESLKPGTEFLWVPIIPTGPAPDVHMEVELAYYVALAERIDEESIMNTVGGMTLAVWGVLETFRRFFPS